MLLKHGLLVTQKVSTQLSDTMSSIIVEELEVVELLSLLEIDTAQVK